MGQTGGAGATNTLEHRATTWEHDQVNILQRAPISDIVALITLTIRTDC